MTVIAQNVSVSFTGSGSVGPFSFNFPISSPAALKVIQNNALLPVTAYTINPLNNNYDNGGSVTLNSPCPVGQSLILQRSTPLTQASVFADNLPQPMQQFEDALDKLTEIDQELAAAIASIVIPGNTTYVVAGPGIQVTGTGTSTNPYIISLSVGLTISSFMGAQNLEIGQPLVNPSFTAAYSGSPTSANITNTAGINSPFNLTTPFTSATITGTFTRSTPGTIGFTLTATNSFTTVSATLLMTINTRIFAGVGAAGATASVTASGNNAILSTGDSLGTVQLGAESVGLPLGSFFPSNQYIYFLLTQNGHTFIDAATGFPLAMNAPQTISFVNQYGTAVTMYLYRTTNPLTATTTPFQPQVKT